MPKRRTFRIGDVDTPLELAALMEQVFYDIACLKEQQQSIIDALPEKTQDKIQKGVAK